MLNEVIIGKTLRVPRSEGRIGDGAAVARQLDAVLVGAGFTASRALMWHVSCSSPSKWTSTVNARRDAVRVVGVSDRNDQRCTANRYRAAGPSRCRRGDHRLAALGPAISAAKGVEVGVRRRSPLHGAQAEQNNSHRSCSDATDPSAWRRCTSSESRLNFVRAVSSRVVAQQASIVLSH